MTVFLHELQKVWFINLKCSQLVYAAPKWPKVPHGSFTEAFGSNYYITFQAASIEDNALWKNIHKMYSVSPLLYPLLKFMKTAQAGVRPADRHFNSQLTKGPLAQASAINWGRDENNLGLRLPVCCPLLRPSWHFSLFRPPWAFLFPHYAWLGLHFSLSSTLCLFKSFTQFHFTLSKGNINAWLGSSSTFLQI